MIADWDDAYASAAHVAEHEVFPSLWAARAAEFSAARLAASRAELDLAYGVTKRERIDLYYPDGPSKGLAVFVHGGDWMRFDKSTWSHLGEGPVRRGWTVAIPSFSLTPSVRIRDITRQIGHAIAFAANRVPGPIALAGHCCGGHLVARMGCIDGPLGRIARERIERIVAIGGVFDLRPLMRTRMNKTLRLDEAEAADESPALKRPISGLHLIAWVGGEERPEYIRQSELIANVWTGLGAATKCVRAPGRNHYDVVADLSDPEAALTATFAP